MDKATVIGIVVSYAFVLASLVTGAGVMTYVNMPSVLIVVGGTFGILFINFPMSDVLGTLGPLKKAFFHKSENIDELIANLVEYSVKARKNGILSLENSIEEMDTSLMKTGLQMVLDGEDPKTVKAILETDLENREDRHKVAIAIFDSIGAYAPAMGMIGTLIGLVAMLKTMKDPSTIGPNMAVALITTFYGAIIANMFALPISGKLALRANEESLIGQIVIEGIMSIQQGDNPRIMEQKLHTFLPPRKRKSQFDKS